MVSADNLPLSLKAEEHNNFNKLIFFSYNALHLEIQNILQIVKNIHKKQRRHWNKNFQTRIRIIYPYVVCQNFLLKVFVFLFFHSDVCCKLQNDSNRIRHSKSKIRFSVCFLARLKFYLREYHKPARIFTFLRRIKMRLLV